MLILTFFFNIARLLCVSNRNVYFVFTFIVCLTPRTLGVPQLVHKSRITITMQMFD